MEAMVKSIQDQSIHGENETDVGVEDEDQRPLFITC